MAQNNTSFLGGGGYNKTEPIGIAVPSNHISNEPYHEWLKEKYGHLKMERDKCFLCGEETKWPAGMGIELRSHYVKGVGQLCESCWEATGGRVIIHPD
jgi:hypothetical protein